MHDLAYLIVAIAGLIGALTTAYKAFTKSKTNKEDKEEQDAELYRTRWLNAEKGNDRLRREVDRLRKKDENEHQRRN